MAGLKRRVDASALSANAAHAEAVSNAADPCEEVSAQANAREDDTFGIDPAQLNADLVAGTKQFLRCYEHAKNLEHAAKHSKHYQVVEAPRLQDDGSIDKEARLVRTGKTTAQRIQERNRKDGERAKRAFNHLSSCLHDLAGRPRKTGSNYGSRKGSGSLVAPATLMPVEQFGVAVSSGKLVTAGVRGGAMGEQPGPVPSVSVAGEALVFGSLPTVVADAIEGADSVLTLSSTLAHAKANLLRHEDALRNRRLLGRATAAEAMPYLAFRAAGDRLIAPTVEEQAADAIAIDLGLKGVLFNPASTSVALGAQIAGHVAPVSAAAVGMAAGPLGMLAGGADLHQARQEYLRRVAQTAAALQRKQVMEAVLNEFKEHPGASVLSGAMASLDRQQDRLIWQAKREKGFAKIRAIRAGAAIGGGAFGTAFASAALAGLVAASAATPAAALLAVPPLAGGGAIAWRSLRRHRAEHTSKWRQRAAAAAVLGMSREALEQKLSLPRGHAGAEVTVTLGEGEYLAKEDRFAGERTITFDVHENEYVGLHVFALQIQDLVRNRDGKAAAPWIETLRGLGVDTVQLLAICKVASAMPAHQRLDFIKSQIAPALGMKYRMSGSQVVQHPSVFLKRFRNALVDAGIVKNAPPSPSSYRRVREQLLAQFGDGEEAMAAFKASIGEFLRKTEKLPSSPLRSHLRAFLALDGLTARPESTTTFPEIMAHQVVEFFRTAPADFHAHVHRKMKQHGFGDDDMVEGIYLGAAALSNLPAREAARIEAQMNAFLLRLDRA